MQKKKIILKGLGALAFSIFFYGATAQQDQRIHAAYILALGRDADGGEMNYWKTQGNLTVGQIIDRHKQWIVANPGPHANLINRAYIDALGRNATPGEIEYWKKGSDDYTDLMQKHMAYLNGSPAEYAKTINSSYRFVFGRAASQGEINYWQGQPKHSYVMLVACHQDYKARNASAPSNVPLNMGASNTTITSPVSGNILAEISSATGLVASGGGNLVASGGGNLVASGGGNLVAAGGGNLVASGGGN